MGVIGYGLQTGVLISFGGLGQGGPQIHLASDQDARHLRTILIQLVDPLLMHVPQRLWLVDGITDQDHVTVGIA